MSNFMNSSSKDVFPNDLFGPSRALAALTVTYGEQLVLAQIEAGKMFSDAGIDRMRSALGIQNPEDLVNYFQGQAGLLRRAGERAQQDAENLVKMHQLFSEQVQAFSRVLASGQAADKARSAAA